MGGKIGVVVVVKGANEEVAKDVAMQAAAMNPIALTRDEVPAETVEKETPETVGCLNNKIEWKRKNVDYNQFAVIVPGDKFLCSTEDSEYVEASVQGLKAKLREKKA